MHKLTRPQTPACLAGYRHGLHNWGNVTAEQKTEIWQQLNEMQQQRCAYCERSIVTGDSETTPNAHIEHFRQKAPSRYPQGTFEWANLFGSCDHQDSCGKYKDKQPRYPYQDLIKMDEEDPETFFLFVGDGTIAIRAGLTARQKHRADETLRIFNLDAINGPLRQMRKAAARNYIKIGKELAAAFQQDEDSQWLALLTAELEKRTV